MEKQICTEAKIILSEFTYEAFDFFLTKLFVLQEFSYRYRSYKSSDHKLFSSAVRLCYISEKLIYPCQDNIGKPIIEDHHKSNLLRIPWFSPQSKNEESYSQCKYKKWVHGGRGGGIMTSYTFLNLNIASKYCMKSSISHVFNVCEDI